MTSPTRKAQTSARGGRSRTPTRGLLAQISMILFQPITFFREIPTLQTSRQWAWMAFLIVLVVGFSTIQQANHADSSGETTTPPTDEFFGEPPMMGMGGGGGFDFGGPPIDGPVPSGAGASDGGSSAANWEIALIAAAGFVLVWLVQAALLSEVSLFRGQSPNLGDNLQIAIWASVPLAVMAALQLVFAWTGGEVGQPGISGLIAETPLFESAGEFGQKVLIAFSSNLTLFWLWSLILLYIGARQVLKGHVLSSAAVVAAWVIVLTLAPVVTNQVTLPTAEASIVDGGFPSGEFYDGPFFDEMQGNMPGDEIPPFEGEMLPEDDFRPDEPPMEGEQP